MLEMTFGGKIYLVVSITFVVLALAHLILLWRILSVVSSIRDMLESYSMFGGL